MFGQPRSPGGCRSSGWLWRLGKRCPAADLRLGSGVAATAAALCVPAGRGCLPGRMAAPPGMDVPRPLRSGPVVAAAKVPLVCLPFRLRRQLYFRVSWVHASRCCPNAIRDPAAPEMGWNHAPAARITLGWARVWPARMAGPSVVAYMIPFRPLPGLVGRRHGVRPAPRPGTALRASLRLRAVVALVPAIALTCRGTIPQL